MRDELAKLVHPVMAHALALKERLDGGEVPHLETEQATILGMLLSESEARRLQKRYQAAAMVNRRNRGHATGYSSSGAAPGAWCARPCRHATD